MSFLNPFKYKEQPDLAPDAPRKKGFFLFMELYVRKFWRLTAVNAVYFAATLPILAWVFYYLAARTGDSELVMSVIPGVGYIAVLLSVLPQPVFVALLAVSVLLYGPITMGLTYVCRNFAREEHAWFSDMFSRAWKNAFQGVIIGIIDIIITLALINSALGGTRAAANSDLAAIETAIVTLSRIGIVIWLFLRQYLYLQAVTIKLNVFHIFMNSLRFVMIGFGRNLISTLACAAVCVVCFLIWAPLTMITLLFVFYALTGFITIFTIYPVIKKHIIDRIEADTGTTENM
ncbi:MAG: hypothetical protein LBD85_02460 [Oscillospiraceae bacterium]|jgi:hypothetical protein|nr:hypothetical protein [Oscillospiraceae bacterium]